jgi:hypothetical protein
MSMSFQLKSVVAAALAVLMLPSACALAADDLLAFQLAKKNPKAMQAWRKIVPKDLSGVPWINDLNGATLPMQSVTMRGRPAYMGVVCMPDNCGNNVVVFLIAQDGSAAAGAVGAKALGIEPRAFGDDDPATRRQLEELAPWIRK